ncbi:3-oxoacyl-ACP reductase FabG [Halomonas sp. KO116]|uniref:3-oxoacyl-ACP reductase FabG n=1 Tax=Halomonas sp. KO116 TaxID=1504981 RepID=UPI0004E32B3B|nr:3-oxoacyl-ACP reductase FabG [Halomonas sp. KO116]AJY48697.1 3-oxoacyl-(acyl-carrier-protein) reductase [Halomonas sp. KO116]TDV97170.1 3-oxoacyl-[acyl-carrier-protein] reductase [Halomonas alkaliantarctica]
MRLHEKVAVVTGAGRGLGAAMAERLADEGARVVVVDIDGEAAQQVSESLTKQGHDNLAIACNVADRTQVVALFRQVKDHFGRLDVLVNNAGITRDAAFLKMTDDQWNQVIDVNLTSMFICTQEAARYMVEQQSGRIVCISSLSGNEGNFGQANYSAAKAGVIGFVKSLSKELARKGVLINAVSPGFIESEMTAQIPEKVRDKLIARVPQGRGGLPEEVASVVAFLASDDAAYVNGQTLNVNGGMYV